MSNHSVYVIEDSIELPAELQLLIELDSKAIDGIKSGYFTSSYKAALELASQYKPDEWHHNTEDQKVNYTKKLVKRYKRKLKKWPHNNIDDR